MIKRVVITGGTGFIGGNLVQYLVQKKIEVIVLSRSDRNEMFQDSKYVRMIKYNSSEYESLKNKKLQIDIFFHLAWSGVDAESKDDSEKQMANIVLSMNMLEYSKDIGAKKFIASGTVAEYVFCENIMNVNEKQTPNDMYGAAKVATHYLLEVKARQINQAFIWAVLPSTYGEGRKGKNIITYTIEELLRGNKPIYGDLNQMWDFLYVGEVSRALYYIGNKGKTNKTYGIGSGVFMPLKEYVIKIRDLINKDLELGIGENPELSNKTFSSCVSIYDLTSDTGYIPKVNFEKGISKTIDYYRKLTR